MSQTASTTPAPLGAPASPATTATNPWLVLAVLCLGFFMILLDITIVNIALPSMILSLGATVDEVLWVINAYVLVYAVLLITAGRLGDMWGQKRMFVAGLTIFTVSSGLCAISHDVGQLVAARVLQGLGGAVMTPQTLAILTSVFPPERRGAAFGTWSGVAGLASVAGPALGGIIVTHLSWNWIFFLNLPLGIITVVMALAFIPNTRTGRSHSLDVVGVLLATVGLFGIVFGLIEAQRYQWGEVAFGIGIWHCLGGGAVLLVLWVMWERRQPEPMVPHQLFKNRNYILMNWVGAAMSFGMLGLFFPITIYLQSALRMNPLDAGLTMMPMSIGSMLIAPFAGRLADRVGGKYILMSGLLIYSVAMGIIVAIAGPASPGALFLLPFTLGGVGLGLIFAPLATIAMREVTVVMAGAASGFMNTTRQIGSVLGSAVAGAVLEGQLAAALREQSSAAAAQVPEALRSQFVAGFTGLSSDGTDLGRVRDIATFLPPGLPVETLEQLQALAQQVFASAFVDAMRPTLTVSVLLLAVSAVSCAFIRRRRAEPVPLHPGQRPG